MSTMSSKAYIGDSPSSSEFLRLLDSWGKWSRFFGGVGYHSGHTPAQYDISDEVALIVDKAMCKLKASKPNLHALIELWYIRDLDTGDILSLCKGRVPFVLPRHVRKFLRYLKHEDVTILRMKAEALLWEWLNA